MIFNFISPSNLIKKTFPGFIWENERNEIILTFDDGPFKGTTEIIVNFLTENDYKAIFFLTGSIAEKHIDLLNIIDSTGNVLGNHSFTHNRTLFFKTTKSYINEIEQTENLLSRFKNFRKYFRPPYGLISPRMFFVLKQKKYKIFMWSLLTEDYKGDFSLVKWNIENFLRPNSIIVFHNNIKAKPILRDSLNYLNDEINKRGYKIGNPFLF